MTVSLSGSHDPRLPITMDPKETELYCVRAHSTKSWYLASFSDLAFWKASGPDSKGTVTSAMVIDDEASDIITMSGRSCPGEPGIF